MTSHHLNLSNDEKETLLTVAYQSVEHGVKHGEVMPISENDYDERLRETKATFVTLRRNEELRGCIGVTSAYRPLVVDVAENAYAAAFRDSRFLPLSESELEDLDLSISILTEPEKVAFSSEEDLISKLRPGIDGIILEEGYRKGSFLPAMWERLPDPEDFLERLKVKAGFTPGYWSEALEVWRYTAEAVP